MKKISKILLPIASTIAVAAPMVCMTSCGANATEFDESLGGLCIKNLKIKGIKNWKVTIDFKHKWPAPGETGPIEGSFAFVNEGGSYDTDYTFQNEGLEISVNGEILGSADWEMQEGNSKIQIKSKTIVENLQDSKVVISVKVLGDGKYSTIFLAK